ncbi:GMC family oxidoreductase [Curtobacterium sp. SGAir0471]|uniref:GMC family oxidoreductase n=1 Tax=Curtobacterium sp. SGAir0471 TaxID=2070337 RepID=UPI00158608A7|nr:GMC family oxidoreductase [Curtobacterium sp. SGAir0471]
MTEQTTTTGRTSRRRFLAAGLGVTAAAAATGAVLTGRPGPGDDPHDGPRRPTVRTDALTDTTEYDYVVVGAGAGGVPLAVRLAEAGHSVLVLEAGPAATDPDVYSVPAFHLFASSDPQMSWDFWVRHYTDTDAHGSAFVRERDGVLYPRASTLGGCTAHHALLMLAPESDDWDRIGRATGDPSWNASVMQRYQDRVREWLPIETSPAAILTEDSTLARIVTAALVETGHLAPPASDVDVEHGAVGGTLLDPNDPRGIEAYREGTFLVPQSTRDGRRYGTRERLLEAAPRLEGRLAVQTDALVERITFDTSGETPRATGVEAVVAPYQYGASPLRRRLDPTVRDRARVHVTARREVVVATGAFNTPQLLMLSGVGPAAHLRQHGVDVVVDAPGVGGNLQDRYEMTVVTEYDRPFSVLEGKTYGRPGDPGLRDWRSGDPNALYRSNGILVGIKQRVPDGSPHPELFVFGAPSGFTGYRPGFAEDGLRGGDHFSWAVIRGYQQSMDGTVRLRSADPTEPPAINFRYFDDGGDSPGVRQDLRAVREGIERARRITATAHRLRFGDATTDREVFPGAAKRGDDLDAAIRADAWGHHASCTARMGRDGDPHAVLDSDFRVRGTAGLRVVDASVFPSIPALFPLMTIFAVSERAADQMLHDARTDDQERRP